MEFRIGNLMHGFVVKDIRELGEIDSTGYLFEHEKSGARLVYLSNQDDNKSFTISFRTPPDDDTGLPHILEHSVLCGSRKYPLKEPMFELIKGSLYTFLNAFTASDRTMYPVASRNERDFVNLMDVYLDAVFYPNIHRDPLILKQEGWHYHLEQKEEEIRYNGVVYNEMKGAFSSPEQTLSRLVESSLFPDNCYGFESGGHPDAIPQLTQKQFTDFHKKYYHPSNSYIVFYGNGNIEEHLQFVNDNYLKEFDRIAIDSTIHLQKPFTQPVEVVHEYPLSSEDSEEGKAYLAINKVIGPVVDPETYLAFGILEYILLGTPSAPLKKALLNAGIAKDIYGDFSNNSLQTYFSIFAKYADPNDAGKFRTIVRETLTRLADKGLDPKLVEAAINKKEFHLREAEIRSYPKGLFYAFKLLDSWLYDGDPFMHIQYGETLRKIKGRLGYFEELIRKYLLDNPHGSFVSLVPRKGLNEENAEKLRSKLAEFRASLSEAEIDAILEETAALHQKQITPDSPEALASIPRLQLADVNREAEELPLQVESLEGKELLTHPQFTNQIAYLSLYFDSRTVPQDKLPYLSLLPQVLGQVSTTARDYSDLINEINLHTGGISFDTDAMETSSDDSEYSPRVIVRTKALVSKFPQLISLLNEIIHNTRFDEDFRLREILRQAKADIGGYLMSAGHIAVMRRLHSYHSPMYRYLERMNNVEQIRFIMDMEKNLEENLPLIRQNLEEVFHLVFRAENLRISLAAETDDLPKLRAPLAGLIRGMDSTVVPVHEYVFESGNTNEGFVTPANVQYVAKGYNFRKLGHEYSGSAAVLSNVIQLGYLLAKVRIQGGAYGAFCGFSHNGISFFCSYRDPHLRNTLKVYDELPDFVESINLTDRELLNYILGVISQQDMPLSPSQKAERVTRYHFRGLTREKNQAIRDQILGTRVEQLRAFAPVLRRMMGKNVICVLGNEGKLRENADLFGALINLFK